MDKIFTLCLAMVACGLQAQQEGDSLLLNRELDVLTMTDDQKHLFTGHGTDVIIRGKQGTILKRIQTGEVAHFLKMAGGLLFAGTPHGILIVESATGETWRLALDFQMTKGARQRARADGVSPSLAKVLWLTGHGDIVWACIGQQMYRIDPFMRTMQIFGAEDLDLQETIDPTWDAAVALDDGLWVEGHEALTRISHTTDEARVWRTGIGEIHITGISQNAIWCDAGKTGPCFVDRLTGQLTYIEAITDPPLNGLVWNPPYKPLGRNEAGEMIFESQHGGRAVLRRRTLQLLPTDSQEPALFPPLARRPSYGRNGKDSWIVDTDIVEKVARPFRDDRGDWTVLRRDGRSGMLASTKTGLWAWQDGGWSKVTAPTPETEPAVIKAPSPLPWAEFQVIPSISARWRQDPRITRVALADDSLRSEWLDDANPIVRAVAIAYMTRLPLDRLEKAAHDPHSAVREAALFRILTDQSAGADGLLKRILDDPSPSLRCHATVGLLKRGVVPAERHLETVGRSIYRPLSNHRVGSEWSAISIGEEEFWRVLAGSVDETALSYMQKCEEEQNLPEVCLDGAGHFLASHPEALLRLVGGDQLKRLFDKHAWLHGAFAIKAGVKAGPAILPALHYWLRDADPRRRVFAAIICGSIADKSSLGPLVEAFHVDDGLALGAVVTALGRLKCIEAVPMLTALFPMVDQALNGGFSTSGISREVWLRDKAIMDKYRRPPGPCLEMYLPTGCQPVYPETITNAIGQIGPKLAQDFFRQIAKRSPWAAAKYLRPDKEPGHSENIRLLKMLLQDRWDQKPSLLAYHAAVSLLHFDLHDGDDVIRHHLGAESGYHSMEKLERLSEVPHSRRAFVDELLKKQRKEHYDKDKAELIDKLLAP